MRRGLASPHTSDTTYFHYDSFIVLMLGANTCAPNMVLESIEAVVAYDQEVVNRPCEIYVHIFIQFVRCNFTAPKMYTCPKSPLEIV